MSRFNREYKSWYRCWCVVCGGDFVSNRFHAKTCSAGCRQRYHRAGPRRDARNPEYLGNGRECPGGPSYPASSLIRDNQSPPATSSPVAAVPTTEEKARELALRLELKWPANQDQARKKLYNLQQRKGATPLERVVWDASYAALARLMGWRSKKESPKAH